MPMYRYTGRSPRGELVSGQLDGDSAESIAAHLLGGGITPIDIRAISATRSVDVSVLTRRLGFGWPKIGDLVLFSRQMYTITKSGIPLLRGMRSLAASTHNPVLREALEDIVASLEAGRDLASSFARHPKLFPALYTSVIRVGETTGTLEGSFLRLADYLSQDQELQDRVKSALRYPMIVVGVIAVAVAVLTTFVIPHFAPLFKELGNDIPLPTRILMASSTFVQHYWYLAIGTLGASVLLLRQYVGRERGRYQWHKLKLRLPVVGKLVHESILARVSRSLAISLTAGMPMIQTLNLIARSAGNDYMAERIGRLRAAVERGDSLSRAATTVGMFPPLVLQMMEVGEETGEISELLEDVAGYYGREVDFALKNLTSAIEPILVVMVGGMVLVLALGVFLPMWQMISKVSAGQ